MVMKAKKRRPSKHERLLKALLKSAFNWDAICMNACSLTDSQMKQLIAIKEAMEKGARV